MKYMQLSLKCIKAYSFAFDIQSKYMQIYRNTIKIPLEFISIPLIYIEVLWNIFHYITLILLKVLVPCALCFFTYWSMKVHFILIEGSEGNRIYNYQSFQLRNNEFRIFLGVGDCQPLQNIIITILYHKHFLHGTSTFKGSSVPYKWHQNTFIPKWYWKKKLNP
jgi:hypothetical protein